MAMARATISVRIEDMRWGREVIARLVDLLDALDSADCELSDEIVRKKDQLRRTILARDDQGDLPPS